MKSTDPAEIITAVREISTELDALADALRLGTIAKSTAKRRLGRLRRAVWEIEQNVDGTGP